MPEFFASEIKTARVTITNTAAKAFGFKGRLFIGLTEETESIADFHLNAGESKEILFTIAMPAVAGTYAVYLSVHTNDALVKLYRAEDITVISDTILEVGYSSRMDGCLHADVYSVLENVWRKGRPSMLYPDIPDEKIAYSLGGDKALICPAWGSWPIIYWRYRGPFQAAVTPGIHRFDAATGKLDGTQLTELSVVANRARVTGTLAEMRWTSIGWQSTVDVAGYEDVPGYHSIGGFLPRRIFRFWADLSKWPEWYYDSPRFTLGQLVQAEVRWAYRWDEPYGNRYAELYGTIWPI